MCKMWCISHYLFLLKQTCQNINIIQEVKNENLTKRLNFTPAFLFNGFIFPQKYEKEDILYFVQDLVEDEEI